MLPPRFHGYAHVQILVDKIQNRFPRGAHGHPSTRGVISQSKLDRHLLMSSFPGERGRSKGGLHDGG